MMLYLSLGIKVLQDPLEVMGEIGWGYSTLSWPSLYHEGTVFRFLALQVQHGLLSCICRCLIHGSSFRKPKLEQKTLTRKGAPVFIGVLKEYIYIYKDTNYYTYYYI